MRILLLILLSVSVFSAEYQIEIVELNGINRHFRVKGSTIVLASRVSGPEPIHRNYIFYSLDNGNTFDTLLLDSKDLINETNKEWKDFINIDISNDKVFCVFDDGSVSLINLLTENIQSYELNNGNEIKDATIEYKNNMIITEIARKLYLINDTNFEVDSIDIDPLLKSHVPEFKNGLEGIHRFNENEMILISMYYGQGRKSYHYTSDLGKTWEHSHYNNTSSVWTSFVNPDLGISHGFQNRNKDQPNYSLKPVIHRITNKGKDRELVMTDDDEYGPIRSSIMLNEKEWFAVNDAKIFYTLDGGNNWKKINKLIDQQFPIEGVFLYIGMDAEGKFWINTSSHYIFSFANVLNVENNSEKENIYKSEYYDLNGRKLNKNKLPLNTAILKINYNRKGEVINSKNIMILE